MIPAINDINEINKIIRNELIIQSGLSNNLILNALSSYGITLNESEDDEIFQSIKTNENLMLFYVENRTSDNNVSFSSDNEDITYYKSYRIKIIIYGDTSENLAVKVISRLRSSICRQRLWDKGIYIESINDSDSVNEFRNGVMWKRSDFNIDISVRFLIKPIIIDSEIQTLNNITIKENNYD